MWALKASQVALGILGLSMMMEGNFSTASFIILTFKEFLWKFFVCFDFCQQQRKKNLSNCRCKAPA
jgi:hypothetical protein